MTPTTFTRYCNPGHTQGSRPYAVPVPGNNERDVPLFVAYHGREYLDADGDVVRHPVRFEGYAAAQAAIAAHEEKVKPTPITEPGPDFARAVIEHADDLPPHRGRDEYEVAVLSDGSVLLDVYAHSSRTERLTVPADHALALHLRALLAAARAGTVA